MSLISLKSNVISDTLLLERFDFAIKFSYFSPLFSSQLPSIMLKKYYSRVSKLSTKGKSNFKSLILPRFRSFARNLMTSNTEKITSVYRDISKIPFVEQGMSASCFG